MCHYINYINMYHNSNKLLQKTLNIFNIFNIFNKEVNLLIYSLRNIYFVNIKSLIHYEVYVF
jgi:hypothetical protein